MAWGGVLILTGYFMGSLYDHQNAQLREMRETYHSLLGIPPLFRTLPVGANMAQEVLHGEASSYGGVQA